MFPTRPAAEKMLIASGEMSTWIPRTFGGDRIILPPTTFNISAFVRPNATGGINNSTSSSSSGFLPAGLVRPLPLTATQVKKEGSVPEFCHQSSPGVVGSSAYELLTAPPLCHTHTGAQGQLVGVPRLWLRHGGMSWVRGPSHALQVALQPVLQVCL